MSTAKAKTINLLLYEGDLGGVISIEDSSWNSGELYSSPRDSVSDLLDTDACNKYGVYLLLSKDKVYVGQSSDLAKRITQHTIGKDWWESVVILTTKDDSLNHSDIDYLETILIEKAQKINRLDCDNRKKGNNPKVDKFRRVFLSQYLDEALFLMQLIGVTVFSETKSGKHSSNGSCLINTINESAVLAQGKRAKNEAVSVIEKTGFVFYHKVTYATLQPSKQAFWANPSANLVNSDWNIILNDTEHSELIVLQIPASTLQIRTDSIGLVTRKDAPNRIDLSIDQETLIDTKSGINFSSFVATKVKY